MTTSDVEVALRGIRQVLESAIGPLGKAEVVVRELRERGDQVRDEVLRRLQDDPRFGAVARLVRQHLDRS